MSLISFYSTLSENRIIPYAIQPNHSLPSICSKLPRPQSLWDSFLLPLPFQIRKGPIFRLYYNYIISFSSLPPNFPVCLYLLFFKLMTPFHINCHYMHVYYIYDVCIYICRMYNVFMCMWKHIFLIITCSNCICYCMHVPRTDHLVWDKQLIWSPLKKTISPPSAFLSGLYFFVYGWGLVSFPLYTLEYLLLLSLFCLCLGSHTMKLYGCSFSDT